MKKWMSLVLAVGMLLASAVSAGAEQATEGVILQDMKAPEVVAEAANDGTAAYAVLSDSNGNEVAVITDRAQVGIVDVSERGDVADDKVAARLSGAYDDMMYDEHFSDVKSLKHDGDLKIDINEALSSQDLLAYDLVMYEKFDLTLYGDYADYLTTEGGSVKMTFKLQDWQPAPNMVVSSSDGKEWHIVEDVVSNGDQTITISFNELGVVAFLLSQENVIALTETYQDIILGSTEGAEGTEGTEIYAASMMRRMFTPSVSGKPAPSLIAFTDENGEVYIASIQNRAKTTYVPVANDMKLVITPVSARDYVVDIQIHEHLKWAYAQILNAQTLNDLPVEEGAEGLGASIDALLSAMNTGLVYQDLVVRDLFEVTLYGERLDYLYADDQYLEAEFDVDLAQGDSLVVLVSDDSATWSVLPAEDVTINASGSVTVRLSELGAVAFAVQAEDQSINMEDAVMSPATGE